MSNVLDEDVKQLILNHLKWELEDLNRAFLDSRTVRSEIIKNLSDSYATLSKVSCNENNMKHEPKPIPTETYDKGFKF